MKSGSAIMPNPILSVFTHNFPAMLPKGFRLRTALGPGDFPCKWHFDIKMRCLRHRRQRAAGFTALGAVGSFQAVE